MSSDLTTRPDNDITGIGSANGFELLQRVATMFSKSSLVPKEFQNNVANCSIAAHMAMRMKADPLMVMQNLYVVHGRPGWSSQFLIATFNQCGKFSALRYEFNDAKPGSMEYGCRAWAVELATEEKLYGTWITLGMAKAEGWSEKAGSKWKTMPEQMLKYRAASFFVRTHAPEIAMGLPMADEVEDVATAPVVREVDNIVADAGMSKSERVAAAMKAKTQPDTPAESETVDANQAAIARYEAKIAAAADVDTLTTIFESIEQAGLPELAVERLHALAVERQEALAVPA